MCFAKMFMSSGVSSSDKLMKSKIQTEPSRKGIRSYLARIKTESNQPKLI